MMMRCAKRGIRPCGAGAERRLLLADGAQLIVPPRFSWTWSLPSEPVLLVGLYWLDRLVFDTHGPFVNDVKWSVFRVSIFGFIILFMTIAVVNSWRRKVTLLVHQGKFKLIETALIRPGYAEWPLSSIRCMETVTTSSRTGFLRITTPNETVDILKKRPMAQIDWIVANMRAAFRMAHRQR